MDLKKIFSEEGAYKLYQTLRFGFPKNSLSLFDFRQQLSSFEPVIVLSTGRCGTKWIDQMLKKNNHLVSIHHPRPVMRAQATLAYKYDFQKSSESEKNLLRELFLAGWEESFVSAIQANKMIAIVDCRNSFFAEVIWDLFPKAKFVLLHREPYGFVKSGLNRDWYIKENNNTLNKIYPSSNNEHYNNWENYSPHEKIAWLWNETNKWFLNFLKNINPENKFVISFNDWNENNLKDMFDFMGANIEKKAINKSLNVRVNTSTKKVQQKELSDKEKEDIKKICQPCITKLAY